MLYAHRDTVHTRLCFIDFCLVIGARRRLVPTQTAQADANLQTTIKPQLDHPATEANSNQSYKTDNQTTESTVKQQLQVQRLTVVSTTRMAIKKRIKRAFQTTAHLPKINNSTSIPIGDNSNEEAIGIPHHLHEVKTTN